MAVMTDLTLAQLRLLAWQGPFDPCETCAQTQGHRCRTAAGAVTTPHVSRMWVARGFVARQPEVDELQRALDVADATISNQADSLRTLAFDKATLSQRVDALTATVAQRDLLIEQLDARIAELEKPDPTPEPTKTTRFGMNISPGSSFTNGAKETAAEQHARIVKTYGTLAAAKTFRTGMLPTSYVPTYEGLVDDAFVCFKPDQTALASGQHDAAIRRYLDTIPKGKVVRLVNWQEPDDEMWKTGQFTAAQHKAATDRLCDVVHAHPAYADGRAEVWDCYMGYSLDVNRFDKAAVSPKLDGIGYDRYWNNAAGKPEQYAAQLKQQADLTKSLGINQWALLETGDNPTTFKDGAARAAFWAGVCDEAARLGYTHVLYFNAIGTTGDHRILPGDPYSEPLRTTLAARMTA